MFDLDTLMIAIPALPLTAAVATAVLGPRIAKKSCHWLLVIALAFSCLASLQLLTQVGDADFCSEGSPNAVNQEHVTTLWTWADVETKMMPIGVQGASKQGLDVEDPLHFNVEIALRADALTAIMLVMVTFISTLIAIYSVGYMHGDRGYWRFFSYVSLFVFSMTMLVLSSNFLLLYVFWEAVGVCSYLLIGFWYTKPAASAAAKKAFLVNRIGDFGFALGIFMIWVTYGTLNFHDTAAIAGVLGQIRLSGEALFIGEGTGLAICLLLFVGACGKSAQFPLHVWLPDAMEGPTPVSALIHAATMVTAGIYMVVRCTPLFMVSETAQMVVAGIGGFTALMAGLIAVTQTDLKRVLAYSTLSQLGYLFLSLGTGSMLGIVAGMFHLFTHSFFKALLFLGAGSVMHAMGGVIDIRRFGGLRRLMPITHWTFLVGCLALAGVFPLSGFWSKDMILAAVHEKAHHGSSVWASAGQFYTVLFWMASFTSFLTAFYTFRAFFRTFYGEERIPREAGHHAHESPSWMTMPLLILAVCAAGVGYLMEAHHGFATFLSRTPSLGIEKLTETTQVGPLHMDIAVASSALALLGIGLSAFFYLGPLKQIEWIANLRIVRPLYVASQGKFWFDQIYNVLIIWPLRMLAQICYLFDRYVIDGLVNLVGRIPLVVGSVLRPMQNGMLQSYAFVMVAGLLIFLGAMALPEDAEEAPIETPSDPTEQTLDLPKAPQTDSLAKQTAPDEALN